MTRTQKIYGFRLGTPLTQWRDKFGNGGFRVIKLIPLHYCNGLMAIASNGDLYTQKPFNAIEVKNLI